MNDTLKVLETRRSCRSFKPDMVKEEDIQAVIKAGTYAATGRGLQSPIIIAVTNKEKRDEISRANRSINPAWAEDFDPFYGAPVILIVLADRNVPTYLYDGSWKYDECSRESWTWKYLDPSCKGRVRLRLWQADS